ncbi:MAG: tyrosine--tRNA ligase [Gemmatimonadetes bacterium]|nr:tyrosine--tRNA ligase [Gemmatimonadota bacterium]
MGNLLRILERRGLLHDATPGLADRLERGPVAGYVGFDPTADSLHVGNLLPVMALVWLQRTGGRPIALVGGGTGLVGDPSGKRDERPMLSADLVARNAAAIERQLAKFLDFSGPAAARLHNNLEWLGGLSLLEFLRDTGKHFTVNYMLQKDSVKSRMDTGISFTEFSYMLVQAYDFWHLFTTAGCELQLGGSDQWGNITAGVELIGRREGRQAHGAVVPLLTTSSGAKFGKSEAGNIWLDPAKTSPYRFYQFWLNTEDGDVARLLRIFTTLPLDEIEAIATEHGSDPSKRIGQRRLAGDVTERVHGRATTERVIGASAVLFGQASLVEADRETLAIVAAEVPCVAVARSRIDGGIGIVEALTETGLAASKADARRGIQAGGFSINGTRVGAAERTIQPADLLADRFVALQKGKKSYAFLEVT